MAYQSYFGTPTPAYEDEPAKKPPQKPKKPQKKDEEPKPKSFLNRITGAGKAVAKKTAEIAVDSAKDVADAGATVAKAGAMITPAGQAIRKKQTEVGQKAAELPNQLATQKKKGKITEEQYREKLKETSGFLGKLSAQSKQTEKEANPKRILGAAAEVGSLFVAPELKGVSKVAVKEVAKKAGIMAGAGAAGNVGSTLKNNPDVDKKELAKSAAVGAAVGGTLPVVGAAAGKAARAIKKTEPANELEKLAAKQAAQADKTKVAELPDVPAEVKPVAPAPKPPERTVEQIKSDIQNNADHVKTISGKSPNSFIDADKIKPDTPTDAVPYLEKHQALQKEYVNATSPKPKETQDPLAALKQEALKYKSADEFVKAQGSPLYRGGTADAPYMSTHQHIAQDYATNRGGGVTEHALKPNAKVINYSDIPSAKFKDINDYTIQTHASVAGKSTKDFYDTNLEADYANAAKWAKANGYDAVKFPTEGEVRLLNKNATIPKQQLTDLYNQAHAAAKNSSEQTANITTSLPRPNASPETPLTPVKSEQGTSAGQGSSATATPNESKPASRVYQRLKAENPDLKDDVSYDAIKLKEDAEKAVNLLENDKQAAFDIAMGARTSPDVTSTSTNIAMFEKAMDEGDYNLASRLAKNRSLAQTRRGQELVAEKGSITDNSTSRYVKELIATKMESMGKKYLSGIELKGKTPAAQRMVKIVDREVSKLDKQIKAKKLDTRTALELLDKLECL